MNKMTLSFFLLMNMVLAASDIAYALNNRLVKLDTGNQAFESWWLPNSQSPLFTRVIYLGDGAFHDPKGKSGLTSATLDLAFEGTNKFSSEKIAQFFDDYGASYQTDVKHEYSSLYLSGLVSDIEKLSTMYCHILTNATYPVEAVASYQKRRVAELENLATSPEQIAQRIFRIESLRADTTLSLPANGRKIDILQHTRDDYKKNLVYLTNNVVRKVYLTGPKEVKKIPQILAQKCGWKSSATFSRSQQRKGNSAAQTQKSGPRIFLAPLEQSNQAQLRVGRMLEGGSSDYHLEALSLMKNYFAGAGFISEFFNELRVKRGLTYTVQTYADTQATYGRSGIASFTKNKTLSEMLQALHDLLLKREERGFDERRLALVRKNLQGGYLFSFEQDENLLENILYLHHIGRKAEDLYNFPQAVGRVTQEELKKALKQSFYWNDLTIVVVGAPQLENVLKKWGTVKVVDWRDYL